MDIKRHDAWTRIIMDLGDEAIRRIQDMMAELNNGTLTDKERAVLFVGFARHIELLMKVRND